MNDGFCGDIGDGEDGEVSSVTSQIGGDEVDKVDVVRFKIGETMSQVTIIFRDSDGLFSTTGGSIKRTDEGIFKADWCLDMPRDEWI